MDMEIKEETEEEKIDIKNHFLPTISSCEEVHLPRQAGKSQLYHK